MPKADEQAIVEDEKVETPDVETPAEADDKSKDNDKDVELEDIEVDLDESEDEDESDEESDEEDETEAESESEDDESEEDKKSDQEKLKALNKEMAEKRIQEKRQRELNQKEQQQEYLADAEDDKDLAVRQLQVNAYNNKVEGNSNKLTNGYERAIKDFDVLRDATPEIQAEIDQALDAFQAMHVTIDAYGNPTEVRADLYRYLQSKADSIKQLTGIGARQQSKNKAKEKSKTFTTPNRAPKEPKKDKDIEAFDEEANKY